MTVSPYNLGKTILHMYADGHTHIYKYTEYEQLT